MDIFLKDGQSLTVPEGASAYEAAQCLSEGLAARACAVKINGHMQDLRTSLQAGDDLEILRFEDKGGEVAFRHTSSHIMAQAIKRLWPEAKLAIGPWVDDGFYYDIDVERPFTSEDLTKIEEEMQRICQEDLPIERFTLPRAEALAYMTSLGEPYKVELINDLPADVAISFYRQGEFCDLCAGPHLRRTSQVKAFKLLQISGAYWRGSEKNKMLQRIYGTSFPEKKELKAYLERLEEARKRDHNKLGRELGYFTTTEYIGQGLPILLPKGAKVIQLLQRLVEDMEESRGYHMTMTPFMAKSDLYKISGHWNHYRDNMFLLGEIDEEGEGKEGAEVLAMRPMTCPFQFQAYLQKTRSYRDLPLRYNETSKLFRNESSGEMHGLIRLRQFTISEGHLMVTPEQVESEFLGCLELARDMLQILGLAEDVSYRFSCWDPANKDKYIGGAELWTAIQEQLQQILNNCGLDYETAEGEAAFYGPKLDIQIRNVFGKEDTLITIQIDFQLAERFGMFYTDAQGERKPPYIIHRTSIGCYERTLALLIEKYAGALPFWLAPEQIRLLPIAERHLEAAVALQKRLQAQGFRVGLDGKAEKIGKKIRDAQLDKTPYMIVLGDKEIEEQCFAVRHRKDGDLGLLPQAELIERLRLENQPGRNDR